MAPWWMQSMVYFPHPSWPVSMPTSGQVKRTTESPVSYQSVLSMWGSEYASLMVWLFSFVRSIQNLRLLSFFQTWTTVLAHGLCDFQMAPISSISWIWPSHHHTCGEVYVGSTLWRVSDPLCLIYAWSEQFCPVPGCCTQTGVPIWAAILWPASVPIWAMLSGLVGPGPPRPILFGVCHWPPQKSLLGGLLVAPGWQGQLVQPQPLLGFPQDGCLSCTQIGTLEDPRCSSP